MLESLLRLAPHHRVTAIRAVGAVTCLGWWLVYLPNGLWSARSFPAEAPMIPLFSWLPELPSAVHLGLFAVMVVSLLLLLVGRFQQRACLALMVAYVLACVWDQMRFQPHFVVGVVSLIVITRQNDPERILDAMRLFIGFIYFWAGFGKLNVVYLVEAHGMMMQPLIEFLPGFLSWPVEFSYSGPLGEMLIGVLVLVMGRQSRWLFLGQVVMHAAIIFFLVSYGMDNGVIPLNLILVGFGLFVFVRHPDESQRLNVRGIWNSTSGKVSAVFVVILPLFAIVGFGDHYMQHFYYDGINQTNRIYVSAKVKAAIEEDMPKPLPEALFFPAMVRDGSTPPPEGYFVFNWLSIPGTLFPGPETRVHNRVKETVCQRYATSKEDVIYRHYGHTHVVNATAHYLDHDCKQTPGFWMRLAGFGTVVLFEDRQTGVVQYEL